MLFLVVSLLKLVHTSRNQTSPTHTTSISAHNCCTIPDTSSNINTSSNITTRARTHLEPSFLHAGISAPVCRQSNITTLNYY